MRIISGKYKGRKLATFEGDAIRPTSDRAKEGVFSVLQFELVNKRFYDGFCGSGAMGIEALSRGAKEAVFTDSAVKSCNLTKKNLQTLGETQRVINTDCVAFLKGTKEKFDVIFLDPPYKSNAGMEALKVIGERDILNENGIAIIESGNAVNQPIEGLILEKTKKYGIAQFSFYRKANKDLAVFAGSFDPITKGHKHIVEKALSRFSKVIVAMGINENKTYTFDKYTRLNMLKCTFEHMPGVEVESFDGLLVDFLKENRTVNNVRGIRNQKDFEYEEGMLAINKKMMPEIKNIYISADESMQGVSSTEVKRAKENGESWQEYIPEEALSIILNKN